MRSTEIAAAAMRCMDALSSPAGAPVHNWRSVWRSIASGLRAKVTDRASARFAVCRPAPASLNRLVAPRVTTADQLELMMSNREQLVEREKNLSRLSDREIGEADQRSSPSAKIVHEAIRLEGTEELERPSQSLAWSGLAAGLTMGTS